MKLKIAINRRLIDKNIAGDNRLFAEGWENVELTPNELAEHIGEGIAYCPQLTGDGRRNRTNFLSCDVLSVDIDGTRRIEDVLQDEWVQQRLTILYTTPNHSEERHRFRLVFAVGKTITSPTDMVAAMLSVALTLSGDRSVTDAARLFYGSRGSSPTVFDGFIPADELDLLIEEGKRSNQPDSYKGDHPATVVSKITIDPDHKVKLDNGLVLPFDQLQVGARVHCPFHHDEEPSAFILRSRTGTKGLRCSTCSKTFWPTGTSVPQFDFFEFDKKVKEVHAYYEKHADAEGILKHAVDEDTVHPGLVRSSVHAFNTRYIALGEIKPGITLIKSPKGSGKTEILGRLIKDTDRVLLIGHRVALIGQSCKRLGLKSYLECESGPIIESKLGICLDSLQRLVTVRRVTGKSPVTTYNEFKTVIIDESEQVLAHFLGGTIPRENRDRIFKLFRRLLLQASRIIALDADLNWLSFEMLNKLTNDHLASRYFRPDENASNPYRPCHIYLNEFKSSRSLELYDNDEQLTADVMRSLADGKRVFVTSNSKTRIEELVALIEEEFEGKIPVIQVTSRTNNDPQVVELVSNVRTEALKYQAILTSPSMGTGVDIAFPEDSEEFDVVYGFFQHLITTHFDCDQQLGRVRHPKAVKVWVAPFRYDFDTAVDVISNEIREREAYTDLLADYDERLQPVYHTEDAFTDLAALVLSQQRASKNDLKRHFLELKRQQGYEVVLHPYDDDEFGAGEVFKVKAKGLGWDRVVEMLTSAQVLTKAQYEDIKQRLQDRDEVSVLERWAFDRTRFELFYRQIITPDLILEDDRSRLRRRILNYEQLLFWQKNQSAEKSDFWKTMQKKEKNKLRFLPNNGNRGPLLLHLLSKSPVYDGQKFVTDLEFSATDLTELSDEAARLKGVIENVCEINVRRDIKKKPMMFLGDLMESIGLALEPPEPKVSKGKKVYWYKLSADAISWMNEFAKKRAELKAWQTLYQLHGLVDDDPDFDYDHREDKEVAA